MLWPTVSRGFCKVCFVPRPAEAQADSLSPCLLAAVQSPTEEKFRKVRLTNEKIAPLLVEVAAAHVGPQPPPAKGRLLAQTPHSKQLETGHLVANRTCD